jgi:hypothetical protein
MAYFAYQTYLKSPEQENKPSREGKVKGNFNPIYTIFSRFLQKN